jgi:predicted DNA-binding protein (MmcQ/YjbR family)
MHWEKEVPAVNLKCDPERAQELQAMRALYQVFIVVKALEHR